MANKRNAKGDAGGKLTRRDLFKKSAAAAALAAGAAGAKAAPPSEADFIVIGAGPGGGPLACNLAKAGYKVVLIEAGTAGTDPDLNVEMKVPILFAVASADPRIALNYYV